MSHTGKCSHTQHKSRCHSIEKGETKRYSYSSICSLIICQRGREESSQSSSTITVKVVQSIAEKKKKKKKNVLWAIPSGEARRCTSH